MCRIMARTKGMQREEWLELRRRGIGGSDAGAVCGLNPYVSAMDVYADKRGENRGSGDFDNEAMKQGRDLESYVAARFQEATGLKVRRSNAMYASEKYPFMIADVDRLVIGENAGLECKTASPYSADKWKDGQVPAHYLMQCFHYMAVLGADAWYLAVVIYGKEFKFIKIERDGEVIQNLIRIEENFWKNHVMAGVLPEPDGSDAAEKFIQSCFKKSRADRAVPLLGFDEKLERREEITAQVAELEAERKKIEQEVKLYMQDAETAENGRFLVSWKNTVSNRVDTARLKEEMPEVYKEYIKPCQSRRFQVKKAV